MVSKKYIDFYYKGKILLSGIKEIKGALDLNISTLIFDNIFFLKKGEIGYLDQKIVLDDFILSKDKEIYTKGDFKVSINTKFIKHYISFLPFKVKGLVSIEGNVKGYISKIKYHLKVKSNELMLNTTSFNSFSSEIKIFKKIVNVEKLLLKKEESLISLVEPSRFDIEYLNKKDINFKLITKSLKFETLFDLIDE